MLPTMFRTSAVNNIICLPSQVWIMREGIPHSHFVEFESKRPEKFHSWIGLPPERSRTTLKRTHDLTRDPAAVEITGLGLHLFAIDVAGVHARRIEGDVVGESLEAGRGVWVVPGGVGEGAVADAERIVGGRALPFTEAGAGSGRQVFHFYVLRRNIVDGRVTRLQDAFRVLCIGDNDAVQDDLDVFIAIL
jgi:hypothetical protein